MNHMLRKYSRRYSDERNVNVQVRKKAIWGIGNICNQIIDGELLSDIDFFIDNSIDKAGKEIFGRRIIHPSQIKDWKEIYVIIAIENYTAVKEQLILYDMHEHRDFIWYRDLLQNQDIELIIKDAERFLESIGQYKKYKGAKLIFSDFLAFDKGVCDYVNRWNEIDGSLILFSEAGKVGNEREKKISIPVVNLPAILEHNRYIKHNKEIRVDEKVERYVEEREYLVETVKNLKMGNLDMADGYEYYVCYYADIIVREIIKYCHPRQIIIWNAFYAFHIIVKCICKELDVDIKYMEFGNVPGTIIIEKSGQMGESWPARYVEDFEKISVTDDEFVKTQELLKELKQSGINRNVQPNNNALESIKHKIINDRPIILYAGQNDNASGMQPYTANTKKYHSPQYTSSDEAALHLAKICEKKGWNYIYKPHPMMMRNCDKMSFPKNTIIVDDVNINELIDMSDAIVTILSTVSYIALIREKPVVMLGYTQLKNKGCTYEAFEKYKVESEIVKSLEIGYTRSMSDNFAKHVVRLNKYYFLQEKEIWNN